MTTTQGEHAQTALAHELFAAAQLAPSEGIEDAVSRIAAALTAAAAQPAAPQGVAYAEHDTLKHALWLASSFAVNRYLMSNAEGRWSGAEKATCHDELCRLYVAVFRGVEIDQVRVSMEKDWIAVHDATQELTDNMDEVIGFPLKGVPDYDTLTPKFFDHFHRIATHALRASHGQAPAQPVALPSDRELQEIAMQAAWRHSREPDAPKYLPRSPVHAATWKPHAWVVAAMKDAIEAATQPKKDHHDELS